MATTVQAFPQTVFPVGPAKTASVIPPAGTNRCYFKATAAAFRNAAGLGSGIDFAVEISRDAGLTWIAWIAHYDGGGPVIDKHGTVIDYVDIECGLGNTYGPGPAFDPILRLSDANTRVRGSVIVTGAPVALGPGTLVLS